MARIIGEVRPRYALIENSPELITSGLRTVLCDLAAMGFDAAWGNLPAAALGAPHLRQRAWIVANAQGEPGFYESNAWEETKRLFNNASPWQTNPWDEASPRVCRVDDEYPLRVDRTERIGNAQVPIVAATAWRILGGPVMSTPPNTQGGTE